MRPVPHGRLLLGDGYVVYVGPGDRADRHAHHAVQVARGFDAPVRVELADVTVDGAAVMVPSGVAHRYSCAGARAAVLLVDPMTAAGRRLERAARRRSGTDVGALLAAVAAPSDEPADVRRYVVETIAHLTADESRTGSDGEAPDEPSAAVAAALAYVERAGGDRATLAGAARAAHLSPTRLTHRFSAEVGMSFKRWVQWYRLRRVVAEVASGATLTRAAVEAGYSDSAHLSRTFRRAFGMPASALLAMEVLPGPADDATAPFKPPWPAAPTVEG